MSNVEVRARIENIQAWQAENLRQIRAVRPDGELGKTVLKVGAATQRWIVGVTHVDTGALRASMRLDYEETGTEAIATVYIDAESVNPKGQRPAEYGVYENRRGGSHAFYDIGFDFASAYIATEMGNLSAMIFGA